MNKLSVILFLVFLASFAGALLSGAYQISLNEMYTAMSSYFSGQESSESWLLMNIRLPRVILAATIGAGLSISGATIQGLFRNPLADPSIIGISSGAMLFAVIAIVFSSSIIAFDGKLIQQTLIALAAFAGSLVSTYLVYSLSKRNGKSYMMTMLLAGIAITAFAGAVSGFFIYISEEDQLRDITFWSLGSISGADWNSIILTLPVIFICTGLILRKSEALNALLLGEKEAKYLGFSVERIKTELIIYVSIIVGLCIALTGIIGFVGLVIPHFLRLVDGSDYRYLLVNSAIAGAGFMIITDTLARTIISPAELPIGIITAMIGAPFFLWLLRRTQEKNFSI